MSVVLTIAVINVALGFAIAVMLGRRYRALVTSPGDGNAWGWNANCGSLVSSVDEPSHAMSPAEPVRPAAPQPTKPSHETPEAKTVNRLQSCLGDYHECLGEAHDRLRNVVDVSEVQAIEACLASLRSATQEYLANRRGAEPGMIEVKAAIADEPMFEVYQAAVRNQDAEIERAQARFGQIEAVDEETLAKECGEVVAEATRLIDANHQLRDALETVDVTLRRNDGVLDDAAQANERDELTELLTRAALEASLHQMWARDRDRVRRLCMGLIDIDQMGVVNQSHGHRKGNEVLRAVACVLQAEQRDEMLVSRFAGERFCMLFPDVDLRVATNLIERVRQSLELTRFVYGEVEVKLTVSCSVIESTPDDSPRSLFARAEATLREAKRYGRNRTFLHEGKYPAPVIPPNLTIEERVQELTSYSSTSCQEH